MTHRFSAAALLMFATSCSGDADVSGTYVAKGPNYASMLQIEAQEGRKISGTLVSTGVNDDWRVVAINKPVEGTVEGNAINLRVVHPAGNAPAVTPLSGLVTGDGLDLTFYEDGLANRLTFQRASAEDYPEVVEAVFRDLEQYD